MCWVLNAQMEPIASSSLIPLWTGRMQRKWILSLKSLAQRQQLRVQTLTSSWVCVWLLWRFSVIIACSIFLHSIYEFNLSRLFTLVDYFLLVASRSFFSGCYCNHLQQLRNVNCKPVQVDSTNKAHDLDAEKRSNRYFMLHAAVTVYGWDVWHFKVVRNSVFLSFHPYILWIRVPGLVSTVCMSTDPHVNQ